MLARYHIEVDGVPKCQWALEHGVLGAHLPACSNRLSDTVSRDADRLRELLPDHKVTVVDGPCPYDAD